MTLKNSWICDKEEVILTSKVVQVVRRDCHSSEDSRKHPFYVFRSPDWCNIVPVTEDGKIVMVRQWRIGIDEHTLEIPGGVVDATDERAQDAAVREMTEETGYAPIEGARVENLGWNYPNPAMNNNRCHSFIVGPVRKSRAQSLDMGEMIEVHEVPLEEIPRLIQNGEITHALMINTLLKLAVRSPGGSDALKRELNSFRGL
ncbi:MAG: NUDIX hydrolase [Bdellovibrionota bacterium]